MRWKSARSLEVMTSTANVHPRERIPQAVAAFVLLAALFLGGRPKGIGDAVVHAIALGALGLAAWRWPVARRSRLQQTFFALLVAAISIVVLQLIPLPADVFARLPQRAQILAQLRVAGLDPGWLPMTLDWWGTVRATLALLSFLAMWMLCSTLPHAQRVQLLQLAVATAVPLALLGFVQASGKLDTTGATGVFANRNHFATLMAMLVPFAIAAARQAQQRRTIDHGLVWYGAATALLLAAAMSFSRAGSLLAGLSAVTAMMWLGSHNRHDSRWRASFAVAIAVLAIGYFASDRLLARFHSDLGTDLRWQYFQNAWDVFRSYLPWGSGLGSFRFVYAQAEPMSSLGEFTFALYAHDEWLQVGIEAGLPGLILMAGFVGLVVVLTIRLLRMGAQADPWAKAAAIATLVPLLHSLVDYPLRTLACSTLLALGLSILTDPASTSSAASRIR
jgi:O-antigen ligase